MGNIDYHAVASLNRVQAILKQMETDAWKYVPQMIEKQFYVRVPEARRIIEPVQKHIKGYANAEALTATQYNIIDQLTINLMAEIVESEQVVMSTLKNALIGRTESDVYRRVGLELVAKSETIGRGAAATVNEFVNTLLREGVTAFVDKAGRKWSLHTYANMVCRTTSRQAEVLAVLTADESQDLYQISSHGTTCHICAPLEGRVYSRSGKDPNFPPLALAFGKIDPNGADDLTNSYLNIHPNCLHVLLPWTPMGRTEKEIKEIQDFSSFKKNPITHDPRTEAQVKAYRDKEQARAKWLRDYRQWEKYKIALGDKVPKTFETFQRHKIANDEKYQNWLKDYSFVKKEESLSSLIGVITANDIEITDISKHFIERAVSRKFSVKDALDALQNPKKIGNIKTDERGLSQRFRGKSAEITVNPETGKIITGWRK